MQTVFDFVRYGLCAFVTATMVSACATQETPGSDAASQNTLPWIDRAHKEAKLDILHAFKGGRDGAAPYSALLLIGDTLYGTTTAGGDASCTVISTPLPGCGTVFEVNTPGSAYSLLYRFGKNPKSGTFPVTGPIETNVGLVGTALYGNGKPCSDPRGCGALYEIGSTGGGFKVLHAFVGGKKQGELPTAVVEGTGSKDTLYGVTDYGGSGCTSEPHGCGTVYAFDLSTGTESVVYPFEGGTDGIDPISLVGGTTNGVLYGVTYFGGSDSACASGSSVTGCGTIFEIETASGKETVVYRFKGGQDGAFPTNVILVGGELYGATSGGGGSGCAGSGSSGCGTIFKVDPTSGTEEVLHRFKGGNDGASPNQLLTTINGALYGTTEVGGSAGCGGSGCGTVFKIDESGGGYALVYPFVGGADGAYPLNGLIAVGRVVYGTTLQGGGTGCGGGGCGTIFRVFTTI